MSDLKGEMIKISGQLYLQVKDRVKWWRDENPQAIINTTVLLIDLEQQYAAVHAAVTLPNGAHAEGMGSASKAALASKRVPPDQFLEFAETRAVGRALARLGYGTEDALDDDAPVDAPAAPRQQPAQKPAGDGVTQQQLSAINSCREQLGWSATQLRELAAALKLPVKSADLSGAQAKQLLDALMEKLGELQG